MAKHRTDCMDFKRQVAQEDLAIEALSRLAKRHDVSRNLIRIWVEKYESEAFDENARKAGLLPEYEGKVPALGRLIGLTGAGDPAIFGVVRSAGRPRSGKRFRGSMPSARGSMPSSAGCRRRADPPASPNTPSGPSTNSCPGTGLPHSTAPLQSDPPTIRPKPPGPSADAYGITPNPLRIARQPEHQTETRPSSVGRKAPPCLNNEATKLPVEKPATSM